MTRQRHPDLLLEVIDNHLQIGQSASLSTIHTVAFNAGLKPTNGRDTTRASLRLLARNGLIKRCKAAKRVSLEEGMSEPHYARLAHN